MTSEPQVCKKKKNTAAKAFARLLTVAADLGRVENLMFFRRYLPFVRLGAPPLASHHNISHLSIYARRALWPHYWKAFECTAAQARSQKKKGLRGECEHQSAIIIERDKRGKISESE